MGNTLKAAAPPGMPPPPSGAIPLPPLAAPIPPADPAPPPQAAPSISELVTNPGTYEDLHKKCKGELLLGY